VERCPRGIVILTLVLPTSDPPDAATRAENLSRLRRLGPAVRRLVTVPVGDDLSRSIVRSVVRATSVLQGGTSRMLLADTLDAGIACLLECASPISPSFDRVAEDVRTLCAELDVDDRSFCGGSASRTKRISGIQAIAPVAADRRASAW
jgi:hypothetical protein